jgi:hypothetical protein
MIATSGGAWRRRVILDEATGAVVSVSASRDDDDR